MSAFLLLLRFYIRMLYRITLITKALFLNTVAETGDEQASLFSKKGGGLVSK